MDAFYVSVAHADLALGRSELRDRTRADDRIHIRTLAQMATTRISCHPNAGLAERGWRSTRRRRSSSPDSSSGSCRHGWLNIVGGCCGTTPAHIRALAQMADGRTPHAVNPPARRALVLGHRSRGGGKDNRPLIVGERTNVIGSRLFKQLIAEREVGRGQRDRSTAGQAWRADDRRLPPIHRARRGRRYRSVLRGTDAEDQGAGHDRHHRPVALERALTWCQGKSVINSITLEDGEGQFERSVRSRGRLAQRSSSAPSMRMPGQAQAFTRERKLAVAERLVRLAARHQLRRRTSSSIRWCFPAGPATRPTSAARSKRSKGSG